MDNKVKTAVVLAGGQSSRFYPYDNLGHKGLVTVMGETFISHTLRSLRRAGIRDILIVENASCPVSKKLGITKHEEIHVKFITQEKPEGMGDALLKAAKYLNEPFFVLNAYHFEFDTFAQEMVLSYGKDGNPVLLTKEEKDASQYGSISRKNGKTVIFEKEKEGGSKTRIVGVYLLNKEFLKTLGAQKKDHYNFEAALEQYSNTNAVTLIEAKGKTLSLKYPWDVLSLKDYLLENVSSYVSKSAVVSSKAVISGDVYIDHGAVIMEGAVITGKAYIGKNAYIGTNAVIRDGVCVEEDAVVGGLMEIKNSILMRGATTHSGFIGDTVVGEYAKIAAGFNTANVRLDKKEVCVTVNGEKINTYRKHFGAIIGSHVAFGIKVGTMPGVIIGNNVIIGPGTTVMENIEDNVTYYTEFKKTVKKI